ncbi:divalent-cation tolerance protein CutA [Methylophilus sp. VKM B-3414]|jgi:periplasmic divalent cation tolerance protein|uniref:divalent-cation tolerance protein CutA n=1 Tax=Methylophilus sp. 13 TaxID=2781018 RepID=UPI001890A85F|nr:MULTISPECIES: divalent-cation tolerance protein CutA [unclassified Methylophilus]MBF5040502.1 divalent-cation tolerance protein CutA [Methylophilus sp. 13]MDT7848493.1 divalent-cation tolerance protein CutA [Methylophilus sp. VKM B-3414]
MTPKEEIIIVFTHVPNKACAEHIAQTLLTDKLAACVNISSPVTSIYRWQGQIEQAEEIALSIKTTRQGYAACAARLRMLHPYELPEIVGIHVSEGLPEYLAWVAAETGMQE